MAAMVLFKWLAILPISSCDSGSWTVKSPEAMALKASSIFTMRPVSPFTPKNAKITTITIIRIVVRIDARATISTLGKKSLSGAVNIILYGNEPIFRSPYTILPKRASCHVFS